MKNKKAIKTIFTILISLVFAVFFMWLALGGLDFGKIEESVSRANYFWVLASAVFAVLAYVFRGFRWNYILEPMGYRIKKSNAFWTVCLGYLMNLTIPRSGEIARATALFGVEQVPVEKSFATVVVERVVDLFFMLFFLALTFIFNGDVLLKFKDKLTNYQSGEAQKLSTMDKIFLDAGVDNLPEFYTNLQFFTFVVFPGIGIFILVKFRQKFLNFVRGILDGLFSVVKMKQRGKFFLYSCAIWLCYFFAAYFVCFALEETASFGLGDVFLIITAGTFGMMVPTSGGAGAFHIAVKIAIAGIFVSLGKSQEQGEEVGLAYALISHTMQTVVTLVLGLISIPILLKRKK